MLPSLCLQQEGMRTLIKTLLSHVTMEERKNQKQHMVNINLVSSGHTCDFISLIGNIFKNTTFHS